MKIMTLLEGILLICILVTSIIFHSFTIPLILLAATVVLVILSFILYRGEKTKQYGNDFLILLLCAITLGSYFLTGKREVGFLLVLGIAGILELYIYKNM